MRESLKILSVKVFKSPFFSCVIRQLNEMTNLISTTADFMRSESQTLHSALCNTSPIFNKYYQTKLNW